LADDAAAPCVVAIARIPSSRVRMYERRSRFRCRKAIPSLVACQRPGESTGRDLRRQGPEVDRKAGTRDARCSVRGQEGDQLGYFRSLQKTLAWL